VEMLPHTLIGGNTIYPVGLPPHTLGDDNYKFEKRNDMTSMEEYDHFLMGISGISPSCLFLDIIRAQLKISSKRMQPRG
jgi:hypothetical protein